MQISNQLEPSLNPTKHFLNLKGNLEIFGRVIKPSYNLNAELDTHTQEDSDNLSYLSPHHMPLQ